MGSSLWWCMLIWVLLVLRVDGLLVNITYIQAAVSKGAVCLDGSPPAYHFSPGSGSGLNNWVVHIQGGGWCNDVPSCLERKGTSLGSSKKMKTVVNFSGILENDPSLNPDFFNWNRVKVRYCDGSSFTGDIESVDNGTNLYYRGARVWLSVMEELLARGMHKAENALLSGCSAGGLTTFLHCDRFRSLFSQYTKVKCLPDAAFFINVKNIAGSEGIKAYYNEVVTTHGSAKNLPSSCTSKLPPGMCFFPQYISRDISTPIFILNTAYDSAQITNILVPNNSDPHGTWNSCKLKIEHCSTSQIETLQGFRSDFLKALDELGSSSTRGLFINSCYAHCQSELQETWFKDGSPMLDKTPIARAIGDWFLDRCSFQKIDCPYPCDSSCVNNVFV